MEKNPTCFSVGLGLFSKALILCWLKAHSVISAHAYLVSAGVARHAEHFPFQTCRTALFSTKVTMRRIGPTAWVCMCIYISNFVYRNPSRFSMVIQDLSATVYQTEILLLTSDLYHPDFYFFEIFLLVSDSTSYRVQMACKS